MSRSALGLATSASLRAAGTGRTRPQRATQVIRAEVRRVRRRGGMIAGIFVASGIGILSAMTTLAVLASVADSSSHVVVTTPLEVGGLVSALGVALAATFLVGRDANGHLAIALTLAPKRWMLHIARAAAFAITGTAVCVVVAVTATVAGSAVAGATGAGWGAVGVMLVGVAAGSLVLFAFGIGTLVRSPGVGVLVLAGLLVVLPLALALVGAMLPAPLASVAEVVANSTPTALFLEAIAVSTVPNEGFVGVVSGQLGLAAWAVAAIALAGVVFGRRDA